MGYLKFRRSLLNIFLKRACEKNKLGLVKFFIFWGANKDVKFINKIDKANIFRSEESLIEIAYQNGAIEVAKYLINNSSNISKEELERACRFGSLDIVECLIKKVDSSYINRADENGFTPLTSACFFNKEDIALCLLESREDMDIDKVEEQQGQNALMLALRNKNIKVVEALLRKGANITRIDKNEKVIIKDYRGQTPLMCLFNPMSDSDNYNIYEVKKMIDYLLDKEESLLFEKDILGKSVLMHAVNRGNVDIVRYLIKKGSLLNDIDEDNNNALVFAIKNNDFDMVKCLVDENIDLNNRNKLGKTPLMYAIEQKNLSIIKYLVDNGANINTEDKELKNTILYAIESNDEDIVQYLIRKGADIYIKYKTKTSLMYAIESGNRKMVESFVQAHFNKGEQKNDEYLNYEDKNKDNALIYAFRTKDRSLIDFLIDIDEYNVNVARTNKDKIENLISVFLHMSEIFSESKELKKDSESYEREDLIDFFDYLDQRKIKLSKNSVNKIIDFLVNTSKRTKESGEVNEEFKYNDMINYLIEKKVISDREKIYQEDVLSDEVLGDYDKIKDLIDCFMDVNKSLKEDEEICSVEDLIKAFDSLKEKGIILNKDEVKMVLDFLMDANECFIKLERPLDKNELIYEYEDLIELFDCLKERGITLDKKKILNCIGERESTVIDYLISDNKNLNECLRNEIKHVYEIIKKNNSNIRKLFNNKLQGQLFIAEKREKYEDEKKIFEQKLYDKTRGLFGRLKDGFRNLGKWISKIFYIIKSPIVYFRKLPNKLLIRACRKNRKFLAKLALFFGADINMKYEDCNMSVKVLCENKNIDMLNLLMKKGLDLKRKDAKDKTLLHYAIDSGDLNIVRSVIDRLGTDYAAKQEDEMGRTYLMYAVTKGNLEIIKEFVKIGASIDKQNIWGDTILKYACVSGDEEVVIYLLENISDAKIIGQCELEDIMSSCDINNNILKILITNGVCANKEQESLIIDLILREKVNEFKSKEDNCEPIKYEVKLYEEKIEELGKEEKMIK